MTAPIRKRFEAPSCPLRCPLSQPSDAALRAPSRSRDVPEMSPEIASPSFRHAESERAWRFGGSTQGDSYLCGVRLTWTKGESPSPRLSQPAPDRAEYYTSLYHVIVDHVVVYHVIV